MLDELPETLDETYERILREISKAKREHAHRLLQCIAVAVRPLRIAELAEVLAVDFRTIGVRNIEAEPRLAVGGPRTSNSLDMFDLIAVVEEDGDQVVQFSHFSVKEFLTSPRLADSTPDVSRFHIPLRLAHVILARACLGTLLRLGDHVRYNIKDRFPLARYVAEHWMKHAQIEDVSSQLRKGMAYCASVIIPTKTIRRASPSYNMPPRIGSPMLDSWMFHRAYKKGMQCLLTTTSLISMTIPSVCLHVDSLNRSEKKHHCTMLRCVDSMV